jgi:hypothetical protein
VTVTRSIVWAACAAALAAGTLVRSHAAPQAPAAAGVTAYVNARIIDGSGAAPIERGALVVSAASARSAR